MQVLVLFYSKTGHTEKLAEEVAKGVESAGVKAVLRSTQEVTRDDFLDSAGIIAGSPVYFGIMAHDLKRVFDEFVGLRKKMEDKVGAAFATGGHQTGGKETTIMSIIQCMMIYSMIIVGDPLSASGHYGVGCVGAPDKRTSFDAQKLGERVAVLCKKLR
ncbi:flavodoxin [bacterium BMS3Abin07]|nr:flavodoxin [bacterium BMS3Abin07]GBE31813.1 flavodoxin [bacterium BMS3Bbin05]HDL19959.1 flavodoxin family protein [Nitrospirota bacterium]HDO21887.1 flavodoxin family protein [Nitrospirota bacterium]HDZ87775.1 flavodoxin family protein [Nitrospirota bacterium]